MGASIYLLALLTALFFGAGAYMALRWGQRPSDLDETRPHMPSRISMPRR